MTAPALDTDREADLRYSVCADPADDRPRLVYADWLDEHAGDGFPCPACLGLGKGVEPEWTTEIPLYWCGQCDEQTRRIANGFAARAEFIRVQCELARMPRKPAKHHDRCREERPYVGCTACEWSVTVFDRDIALRRRERELVRPEWWAGIPDELIVELDGEGRSLLPDRPRAIVRRGFVSSVRLTTAAFLGGPCRRCDGGGQRVGADRPFEYGGNATEALRCPDCAGSGRTAGIAPALFAREPVVDVRLVGREPAHYYAQDGLWGWYCHTEQATEIEPFWLPEVLFRLLPGGVRRQYGRRYTTPTAAHAALSRACVQYGRSVAAGMTHRGKCPNKCKGRRTHTSAGLRFTRTCGLCYGTGEADVPGLPPLRPGRTLTRGTAK